jgi:hypothetical protein
LYLASLADFNTKVKPELEGLTASSAKDKKRHSPRRRVLHYVSTGGEVRAKVKFAGQAGAVMASH